MTTLCLTGDVMTGRGVDQILPHPGDPRLRERYVHDARAYVRMAQRINGPIPRPADYAWPWGVALALLDSVGPAVRVLNLETSITTADDVDGSKGIHYRMHPANLPCLTTARPDVCVVANNHVLDFGRAGLAETLSTLASAGVATAGAGLVASAAARPAIVPFGSGRAVVFALGTRCSGIPPGWAATAGSAGVALLPALSATAAAALVERVRQVRQPGDVVVVSIHWGGNWGYEVPAEQVEFAHRLIEGGVDVVHGHSSHHPRPIEIYRGKLVLYGCGDLIDDYEGIGGYEYYRDDLRLLYFATITPGTGMLAGLRMAPLHTARLRLEHASVEDTVYLRAMLNRISRDFGSRVDLADGWLRLAVAES